jgi:protein-tyrosine-phosphatase/peptidoglycan/xylan/chitin deacetylase (PgdA/CDA1 family)
VDDRNYSSLAGATTEVDATLPTSPASLDMHNAFWNGLAKTGLERPLRGFMARVRGRRLNVLLMHRIAQPEHGIHGHSVAELRALLTAVRDHRLNVVSLEDVLLAANGEREIPHDSVAFSIDDGFWDQAEIAAPLFLEYGVPVSMFVITGFVDGDIVPWDLRVNDMFQRCAARSIDIPFGRVTLSYDLADERTRVAARRNFLAICKSVDAPTCERLVDALAAAVGEELRELPPWHRPMTWSQARALEQQGVTFGSHTRTHRIVSQLPAAQVREELLQSQQRLSSQLKSPLPILCWPIGRKQDFLPRDCALAAELGYRAAFAVTDTVTVCGRIDRRTTDMFDLGRTSCPRGVGEFLRCAMSLHQRGWPRASGPPSASPIRAQLPAASALQRRYGTRRALLVHLRARASRMLGRYADLERIDWARVRRLVFVCRGNICRSPYGEARARLLGMPAVSAGIRAKIQAPANSHAALNALLRGVDMSSHQSANWSDSTVTDGDLVLAFEPGQLAALRAKVDAASAQLSLVGLWSRENRPYIADPYGRDDGYYQSCFAIIDSAIDHMLKRCRTP